MRAPLLAAIAAALSGCRAVVCAQIGQAPQMEMERLGLDTFVADGPIKPMLVEIGRNSVSSPFGGFAVDRAFLTSYNGV